MTLSIIWAQSAAFRRASSELSEFVMHAAATTSELVGFTWTGRAEAPSTYPDLQAAVERSLSTGQQLPVSNENCDSVIYASPAVNVALRYWHDVSHVMRGLDFTPPQELQLARFQLAALEQAGIERDSTSWRLLQADLVGQVHMSAVGGRFPADQLRFVERALNLGIDDAVLRELADEVPARRLVLPPLVSA